MRNPLVPQRQEAARESRTCAVARLVPELHGPAKGLVSKWDPNKFEWAGGSKEFIKMLGASHLARQPMAEAVKAMNMFRVTQHKWKRGETMGDDLVQESTLHEENEDALERLFERLN